MQLPNGSHHFRMATASYLWYSPISERVSGVVWFIRLYGTRHLQDCTTGATFLSSRAAKSTTVPRLHPGSSYLHKLINISRLATGGDAGGTPDLPSFVSCVFPEAACSQ